MALQMTAMWTRDRQLSTHCRRTASPICRRKADQRRSNLFVHSLPRGASWVEQQLKLDKMNSINFNLPHG